MERTLQKYGSYEKFEQATGGSLLTKSRIWNHVRKYMVKEGCLGEVSHTLHQERNIACRSLKLHMDGPGGRPFLRPFLHNYQNIPYIIFFSWPCPVSFLNNWNDANSLWMLQPSLSLFPDSYITALKFATFGSTQEWHPSFPPFFSYLRTSTFPFIHQFCHPFSCIKYLHQRKELREGQEK